MRTKSLPWAAALVILIIISSFAGRGSATFSVLGQGRTGQLNLSPEEQNLGREIMSAPDPAAKLKAAAVLIKKYPKTVLRARVGGSLADQIAGIADATQKISRAQEYRSVFTEPSEQELIMPALIEGYAGANRSDEAFSAGSDFLTRNPDSVRVLTALMLLGTDQAKHNNTKFVALSLQYGAKAIELMEADKKPATMDDPQWKQYKTTMLPGLHQSMGILDLVKGDRVKAKGEFARASEVAPSDAFNYLMLAGILNDEYQNEARHYQSMPEGQAKRDELPKARAMLDGVIDAYAHTIALAEGNAALQQVRQQYLQDLETYYKYRHNNSTEGLQQLIDKYKVPPR
jgi:hypothetical protein